MTESTSLFIAGVWLAFVAAGAAFGVWGQIALGGNWSAEVTFCKRDRTIIPFVL